MQRARVLPIVRQLEARAVVYLVVLHLIFAALGAYLLFNNPIWLLAVETVFESMKKALARGDRIELRGFGVFNVKPRKTGIGRNPRTGEEVSIPPGKAVRFKPGKELQSI